MQCIKIVLKEYGLMPDTVLSALCAVISLIFITFMWDGYFYSHLHFPEDIKAP